MLHFVNFMMPLTCFMSLQGEYAVGWFDGMQAGMLCPSVRFRYKQAHM